MLEYTIADGSVCIRMPEELTSANANQFTADLDTVPISDDVSVVYFDASDISYISSAGLRCLIAFRRNHEVDVRITNMSPDVEDILRKTGFSSIFAD